MNRMDTEQSSPSSRLGERIKTALAIWFAAVAVAFVATAVNIGGHPFPRWLELPWNGVDDFAVGADGRIWLHVGLYGMLLSYDTGGRFLDSSPGFTSGSVCLQTAADGRLFVLNASTLHTLSHDGVQLTHITPDRESSFVWRLGADSNVEHVPDPPAGARAHDRPVRPGELLFGDECSGPQPHRAYELPGGDTALESRSLSSWRLTATSYNLLIPGQTIWHYPKG